MSDNLPVLYDANEQPIVPTRRLEATVDDAPSISAFSFGEVESAIEHGSLIDFFGNNSNGRWYEPPVSMHGLAKAMDLPGPHPSCVRLKVNLLTMHFQPSRWLSRGEFRKWAVDFLATGNGYLERRDNLAGRPLTMKHSLSRYTRVGCEEGRYFFTQCWKDAHEFAKDRVFHLMQEHPSQEIYGIPEFLGALQAALLGEAATLFRRRYYLNGSHAGFVFYVGSDKVDNKDMDAVRAALKDAKGKGNFKNLFLHVPGGGDKAVQIIPLTESTAKDEFFNVKRVTRDEMLCAHRTPPQLVGIVPENNGGFGDTSKAMDVFYFNEIEPIIERMLELNDWLGVEAMSFRGYVGPGAVAEVKV